MPLMRVIIAAMAVLNFISSMSPVTFFTVLWKREVMASVSPVPFTRSVRPATRSRKRLQPFMLLSFQGAAED